MSQVREHSKCASFAVGWDINPIGIQNSELNTEKYVHGKLPPSDIVKHPHITAPLT